MTTWFMMTCPRHSDGVIELSPDRGISYSVSVTKRELKTLFEFLNVKRYCIAIEKGKSGYEHYQIRLETSRDKDEFFTVMKD